MSARNLDSATAAALPGDTLYPVWFLRLDIANEPAYFHTGLGNYTFPGGSGYDPAIVGFNFIGVGMLGQMDPITDDVSGSQTLNLSLPGIDLTNDYLKELVTDAQLWQRRQAWLWLSLFTDAPPTLIGKPFRVKTARMDQLTFTIDPDSNTGTVTIGLESQASYGGEALFSRYSEQPQIDASDVSQQYVADLSNKVPEIGNPSSGVAGGHANSSVGSGQATAKSIGNIQRQ